MNAVEIEEAISNLAEQEFDASEFPFQFLEAFGNKQTTIKRLRSGSSNSSDIEGGVLQRNNIHIAVTDEGAVTSTLIALKESPATSKAKAKFVLVTDGSELQAEDLNSGETVSCDYKDFPNHFGLFLPLAGISTVSQIVNNPIDIRATSILNKLYVELLKENEEWSTEEKRHEMNQFMTRLIFCFFAEDTDIFHGGLFTKTIEQMSDSRSNNTDFVLHELFRAMDTAIEDRESADLPRWADQFPYVNGGLFAGTKEVPKFNRIARSFVIHAGNLNWKEINPDIFGSMIQSIAEDDERGEIGMHYTSVPNILKVLNPLFLDDLREQLEVAGDNGRKLLNLRKRIANIRVFDPACGSGNFLVISYIRMREIESQILKRRGEANEKSWIELENFYGIEIKNFAVEVGRLSLLIAEFQCDVRFIGQKEARALVLPLRKTGQIKQGNALRVDWTEVCPQAKNLTSIEDQHQSEKNPTQNPMNLNNHEYETYICGNPPYLGSTWQSKEQKKDLGEIFDNKTKTWKTLDYVTGWFMKAAEYCSNSKSYTALVSTNSVCQGQQVQFLWPLILEKNITVNFGYTSFKWKNLASNNAGVTVVIVGFSVQPKSPKRLYTLDDNGNFARRDVENINPYLIPTKNVIVNKTSKTINGLPKMVFGNKADDGGNLTLDASEYEEFIRHEPSSKNYVRRFLGSREFINGLSRYCIWITDEEKVEALKNKKILERVQKCEDSRLASKDAYARKLAERPHQFKSPAAAKYRTIVVPRVSSENRDVSVSPTASCIYQQ